MGTPSTLAFFLVGVAVMVFASELLVRGLDGLGSRLRLREGLLGLVTALGADAPEISSSIVALHAGARDVGFGVALGSNVFNLAALLGLGAILAGHVRVRRGGLLLDGALALCLVAVVAPLLLGLLAPTLALMLALVLLAVYGCALSVSPRRLVREHHSPRIARLLALAASELEHDSRAAHRKAPTWPRIAIFVVAGLWLVVAGSNLAVVAALTLAGAAGASPVLVGSVALAGLTSVPNAYAAVRLARQYRGTAVVSATLNSNAINIVCGVCAPAVALGSGRSLSSLIPLAWFAAGTVLALLLLSRRGGLGRWGGVGIVGVYASFVLVQIALAGRGYL